VRYGLRTLARTPGFTLAAVLALALGIGATTAIFSVVDAVLLRPLPYAEPDRLAVVLHGGRDPVAPANYLDWRREASAFERMGAAEYWQTNLSGGDRPERVLGLHVTADILPLLGVSPLLGRVFAPDEEAAGRDQVVVLGYRIWQRRFGGDPSGPQGPSSGPPCPWPSAPTIAARAACACSPASARIRASSRRGPKWR
jgi:putative ABC transport system permease protein